MKAIFNKVVSKDEARKEISTVHMNGNKLVATDLYSLIEVDQECFQKKEADSLKLLRERMTAEGLDTIAIKPEELDMEQKILETMPLEESVNFPNYKTLIPSEEQLESEYVSVRVSPKKLAEIALSVLRTFKEKGFGEVVLHVPKNVTRPVVIRRKDGSAVGIVMPLN